MPTASDNGESTREFKFQFTSPCGRQCILRAPISLSYSQSATELSHRLLQAHNLPCYLQKDLESALRLFLDTELVKCQDTLAQKNIDKVLSVAAKRDHISQLVDSWTNSFQQEVLEYTTLEPSSDDVLFCEIYHSLIHSNSLDTLLSLEQTYAVEMQKILEQRDMNIAIIESRQQTEMEAAVNNAGLNYSDEQINRLTQRHFENLQVVESRWASETSKHQETQRNEYRDWLIKLHAAQSNTSSPNHHALHALTAKLASSLKQNESATTSANIIASEVRREESFTVHLGAQLKTTHNLRLISADVLDFCRHQSRGGTGLSAHRLQTAISLYSSSLCGLVLLVDNRLNSYTGIKREFAQVCEQSTDFHFANLEQQFESIGRCVAEAKDWRARKKAAVSDSESDKMSTKSIASNTSDEQQRDDVAPRSATRQTSSLTTGDFYVTRHSSLSEVHIVFHLVTDESTCTAVSEISSRHPVILAYRNILKLCFRNDVKHVTLPLLLVNEMSEEMTIAWCLKRAELVFKCVKGFIMELAMWSGQESFTIQFVVPKTLSDEAFTSICSMLPTIFRMSKPVIARSS